MVDTMEVVGPWADLPAIYARHRRRPQRRRGHPGRRRPPVAQLPVGGCLYFTFAGQVAPETRDAYYRALWDAGQRAVLAHGGSLSHHHGVGLNRARFVREALGGAFDVLAATKAALDPRGILNPGKLGLPSPLGEVGW